MRIRSNLMPAALAAAIITLMAAVGTAPATADETVEDQISFALGAYDWHRRKDAGAEFRFEYRPGYEIGPLRTFGAVALTSPGSAFLTVGLFKDFFLGADKRFVITPSFGPSLYARGGSDLDLDYPLQFRSQLELAHVMDHGARLGLAVSHYSNAGLGDTNPGTESALLTYTIPLAKLAAALD